MSDEIFRPLIEDMTWSYSRITCFTDCPYKWALKYLYGCSEEPTFYSSYGSFMHKLLEDFYNGKLSKEDMKVLFLTDFSTCVQGVRPKQDIVTKYIRAGIEYLDGFEPLPYNMVDVEKKIMFNVSGRPFVGIIDYIGEKDGELYIVDNKSRDLKPRSKRKKPTQKDAELDEMLIQLYLYAEAVRQEYGKFPKSLCFNCFKSKTFIEEPFNMQAFENAVAWANSEINYILNEDEYPPTPDFFKCNYLCGLKGQCVYMGGD